MFKAVLGDYNILKTSFNAISSIVNQVQIQADENGLKLDALSRNHTTFIHLELKKGLFDEYKCDEPVYINLDTYDIANVLKRAQSDDVTELSVDENNFIVTFQGVAERIFNISLIDIAYEDPNPPKLEHPTTFELPFDLLKNSVQDVGIFSNRISLHVDETRFEAFGDENVGGSLIKYLHGEKIGESVQSLYNLKLIKEPLKANEFSESVIIELGNDMPLGLILEREDAFLKFLIAPQIEAED